MPDPSPAARHRAAREAARRVLCEVDPDGEHRALWERYDEYE